MSSELDAAFIGGETGKGQRNEMRMIARAVSILRAIAEQPAGLSLSQIAKATGLARATVQRLVGALENERLVSTAPGVTGVRLGYELARLGAAVHADIRGLFRPILVDLQSRVEDTVDLTLLHEGEAIVIDQVASPRALRVVSYVGKALPIHCTASGKAHLTQTTASEAMRLLDRPLQRHTSNTIVDAPVLSRLAGTSSAGECQLDREEYVDGVAAIGLPIRGLSGGNYAIAVSMPAQRFYDRVALLTEDLRRCQYELERVAGIVGVDGSRNRKA